MRRAARPGDDYVKAASLGARCILHHPGGSAMRGDDPGFVRHVEALQGFRRSAHGLPIGLAAHDNADQWLRQITVLGRAGNYRSWSAHGRPGEGRWWT